VSAVQILYIKQIIFPLSQDRFATFPCLGDVVVGMIRFVTANKNVRDGQSKATIRDLDYISYHRSSKSIFLEPLLSWMLRTLLHK
jgi:hypothetical protein